MKKLIFLLMFLSITISSFCQYSGGNGTLDCPYKIATPTDLQDLMDTPTDWDKKFVQIDDIDCFNISAKPIGNSTTKFNGIYLGNNYKISKLKLLKPSIRSVGLFGIIDSLGIVNGVHLYEYYIEGNTIVGGICGWSKGYISNCKTELGNVKGSANVGGLAGINFGRILSSTVNCSIEGVGRSVVMQARDIGGFVGANKGIIIGCTTLNEISAKENIYVGGFCGFNHPGARIEHCISQAGSNVLCRSYGGGFCGYGKNSFFNDCHSSADVCTINNIVGGFIGEIHPSQITSCSSTGNALTFSDGISLRQSSGGFIGQIWSGSINNCIAGGIVSSDENVGGFVGKWAGGTITNSMSLGMVYCNTTTVNSGDFYGICTNNCSMVNNHACLKGLIQNPACSNCFCQ